MQIGYTTIYDKTSKDMYSPQVMNGRICSAHSSQLVHEANEKYSLIERRSNAQTCEQSEGVWKLMKEAVMSSRCTNTSVIRRLLAYFMASDSIAILSVAFPKCDESRSLYVVTGVGIKRYSRIERKK